MNQIVFHRYGKLTVSDHWAADNYVKINKLYYVYSGYAYCDGVRLTPGNLYLIGDRTNHCWELGKDFEHLFFDFHISPSFQLSDMICLKLSDYPDLESLMMGCSDLIAKATDQKEYETLMQYLLCAILTVIESIVPLYHPCDPRIQNIVEFLQEEEEALFSVPELAEKAHLDVYYFIKLFKKEIGVTPHQYIMDLRMGRALAKLKEGVDIKQVAYECGFAFESSFSAAFKKRFGISPGMLYKMNR